MRRLLFASLLIVLSLPVQAADPGAVYSVPQAGPATVCFTSGNHSTPGGDCAALVVNEIGRAQRSLLVQAYNFSEPSIIAAIIDARLGKGARNEVWSRHVALNDRELECLTWSARGKTSPEIAAILGLSKRTVNFHIENACRKLNVSTRTEAVVKATSGRLIDP